MTNRRDFIKLGTLATVATLMPNFIACSDDKKAKSLTNSNAEELNMSKDLNVSVLNEFYTLNNGLKIPKLGLGLWRIENEKTPEVVQSAIKIGYRHFDSAQSYANEQGLGLAINEALQEGFKREDFYITTKIRAEHKDYESALKSIDESLEKLNLDYIDLILIHSPQPWNDFRGGDYSEGNVAAYKAQEKALQEGKVRSIGVSNFKQKDLENILQNCEIKPAVNQILTHIGNTDFDTIEFCKAQDILVEAYSPIAHGELLKDERLQDMAKKYGVSVPQLCIAYVLEIGVLPLPKSSKQAHIAQNAKVDFKISNEDLETLKKIDFKNYGEHSYFPVFSGK